MPNRRTVAIVVSAALLAGATSGAAAAAAGLRLPSMLIASGGETPSPEVSVVELDPTPKTASPTASSSPSAPAATSPPPTTRPPVTRTKPPKAPRPPKAPERESPKPSWTPKPLPTEVTAPQPEKPTKFVSTTFGTDPSDGKPGHKVKVTVPDGWESVETERFKRDFRDPTKQLTLRVWGVNGFGAPAIEENAEVEFEKRKSLKDFATDVGLSTNSWVAADGRTIWYHWFAYTWTEDGRMMHAVEWYPFQEDETLYGTWTMIGAVSIRPARTTLLEGAMGKALESYVDYPIDL